MNDTDTRPALSVADAAKQAEDARRHAHDLTKRLASGDTDVSADELADARDKADYADLALKGAQARERRAVEEQLKADVESFKRAYPKKLARRLDKVTEARAKAIEAVGELIDAASTVEQTRAGIHADYLALRPEDVPLDHDDDLPEHYRAANPRNDRRVPATDWFKTALAVTLDAMKSRHRGSWRAEQAEIVRTLTSFIDGHEKSYKHAVTKEQ